MPVRFLIYIAITALTRLLAVDAKTMDDMHLLMVSISILILSGAVLLLKIGSLKYSLAEPAEQKVPEQSREI